MGDGILQIVLAVVGTGALTAFVNAWLNRRQNRENTDKTNAERQNIITEAATAAVALIQSELQKALVRQDALEAELARVRASHEGEIRQYRAMIARYELELGTLRVRVAELERELARARSTA